VIDVGPMPTPQTEEPERFPGGADALDDQSRYGEIPDGPVGVDLPPDKNPTTAFAVQDVPGEVTEPDDKPQDPDEDGDSDEGPGTPV
jgi:hypothetical protein